MLGSLPVRLRLEERLCGVGLGERLRTPVSATEGDVSHTWPGGCSWATAAREVTPSTSGSRASAPEACRLPEGGRGGRAAMVVDAGGDTYDQTY